MSKQSNKKKIKDGSKKLENMQTFKNQIKINGFNSK